MRRILTLAIIATFGLAAFSACKKSSGSSSTPAYTLTATVNGTAFSENDTYTVGKGATVSIFSYNGVSSGLTPPYMEITMADFTGVGTYNFDSTALSNFAVYNDSIVLKIAKSGAVVITASSTTSVSGTFSFTTTDGTVVSSGKFTAKRD